MNVGLLYGRYFEKEASYLSEILPGQLLRLNLNFYEYEMLIEPELISYFTAFLNNYKTFKQKTGTMIPQVYVGSIMIQSTKGTFV